MHATRSFSLAVVVATAALGLAGCDGGPEMHQVRGHVFYKDGSVPKGGTALVGFQPTAGTSATVRKGASGVIGPDGAFEMTTRKPGDGVHAGEYDVRFVIRKDGTDPATSLIPAKYEDPATSGYNDIKVDRNISDLKFEIEPLPGASRR